MKKNRTVLAAIEFATAVLRCHGYEPANKSLATPDERYRSDEIIWVAGVLR
jgi:hypothetical protein